MATSEIHWDSKETFCLALPTLREISHKGSQPIRVLCHLNLLFTFLYYFWNKLSTFCEGYVLGTFLWWHLLLFLVWVGLHCSSSLLHRAALQLQCAGFSQHRLSLPSSGSGLWAQQLWRTRLVAPSHVGSFQTRDRIHVSCIGRQIPYHLVTSEALKQNGF